MSKFQRGLILTMMMFIIGVFPASAADFYETQLRLGAEAYRTGRISEAVDYLRIANFGLLDRPALLVEGLARLSLAQNSAGREQELRKTLDRFVSVERRFPSWNATDLDTALRTEFEDLLIEKLSADVINGVESLSSIVPSEQDKIDLMTPAQQKRHYEGKARAEPNNARWPLLVAQAEARAGDVRSALRWSERALDIDPNLIEARVLRLGVLTAGDDFGRAATELQKLPEQAWSDYPEIIADAFVIYSKLNQFDKADELYDRIPPALTGRADVSEAMAAFRRREASRLEQQAVREPSEEPAAEVTVPSASPIEGPDEPVSSRMSSPRGSFTSPDDPVAESLKVSKRLIGEGRPDDAQLLLRDALRQDPGSRELRLAMLEASCLGSDWRTGVSQLLLIEPFRTGEEKFMFYGAVVYFESENPEEAKKLMARALPKLARNAYVDHYATLIMGEVE